MKLEKKLSVIPLMIIFLFVFITIILFISNSQKNTDNRAGASGNLSAQVVAGTVENGTLKPVSTQFAKEITVPQDTGYFIQIISKGIPVNQARLESSIYNEATKSWSQWTDFKTNSTFLIPTNGLIAIDFADYPPLAIGRYTGKIRIKGSSEESTQFTVNVTAFDSSKYMHFQPGNYWVMKGCLGGTTYENCSVTNTYTVRLNVQNTISTNIAYNGKKFDIVSNPWRVTTTPNTPQSQMGGPYDYTLYASQNYDQFGQKQSLWALKTVFFKQESSNTLVRQQLHTAVFLPKNPSTPSYYIISKLHDMAASPDGSSFSTAVVNNPKLNGGNISNQVSPYYQNVGWRTSYRMLKVNFPHFKGNALRIRFWEYDSSQGSFIKSSSVNYDEWFFSKEKGLLGINNKYFRGNICETDQDCSDKTVIMTTPMFSVKTWNSQIFEDGGKLSLKVGIKDASAGDSVNLRRGAVYSISAYNKDGIPYTGFVEVQGQIVQSANSIITINRQLLKGINGQYIWLENGRANVETAASQATGSYDVQIRPYIYNETLDLGTNRLGWSNIAHVILN